MGEARSADCGREKIDQRPARDDARCFRLEENTRCTWRGAVKPGVPPKSQERSDETWGRLEGGWLRWVAAEERRGLWPKLNHFAGRPWPSFQSGFESAEFPDHGFKIIDRLGNKSRFFSVSYEERSTCDHAEDLGFGQRDELRE